MLAAASGLSELTTVTLVTPSTSCSEARNLATASWPAAQPWICSVGPAMPSVLTEEAELVPGDDVDPLAASEEEAALMFVSHTSCGITIASSRSTRSQSNRLRASDETVCSRACCIEAKSANDWNRSAVACSVSTWLCRLAFSALRSETWLLTSTVNVTAISAAARTATTT